MQLRILHFTSRIQKVFIRGGPNLITFLVDEGIKDPNTAINGPSSARQQNAIELAQH